jgi:hypothetical protein
MLNFWLTVEAAEYVALPGWSAESSQIPAANNSTKPVALTEQAWFVVPAPRLKLSGNPELVVALAKKAGVPKARSAIEAKLIDWFRAPTTMLCDMDAGL